MEASISLSRVILMHVDHAICCSAGCIRFFTCLLLHQSRPHPARVVSLCHSSLVLQLRFYETQLYKVVYIHFVTPLFRQQGRLGLCEPAYRLQALGSWGFCLCSPRNLALALPLLSDFLIIVSLPPHLCDVTHCGAPYDVWVIQVSVITWQALF